MKLTSGLFTVYQPKGSTQTRDHIASVPWYLG
jgi:hypothetical protein